MFWRIFFLLTPTKMPFKQNWWNTSIQTLLAFFSRSTWSKSSIVFCFFMLSILRFLFQVYFFVPSFHIICHIALYVLWLTKWAIACVENSEVHYSTFKQKALWCFFNGKRKFKKQYMSDIKVEFVEIMLKKIKFFLAWVDIKESCKCSVKREFSVWASFTSCIFLQVKRFLQHLRGCHVGSPPSTKDQVFRTALA